MQGLVNMTMIQNERRQYTSTSSRGRTLAHAPAGEGRTCDENDEHTDQCNSSRLSSPQLPHKGLRAAPHQPPAKALATHGKPGCAPEPERAAAALRTALTAGPVHARATAGPLHHRRCSHACTQHSLVPGPALSCWSSSMHVHGGRLVQPAQAGRAESPSSWQ